MKLKPLSCGFLAGVVGTTCLTIISMSLFLLHVIPISITEYAARFILYISDKPMNLSRWIVGFLANYSLGCLFAIIASFFIFRTKRDEKIIKILIIGAGSWFFHLAIVPALSPEIARYSKVDVAIPYFIFYLIWASVVFWVIQKYLNFGECNEIEGGGH